MKKTAGATMTRTGNRSSFHLLPWTRATLGLLVVILVAATFAPMINTDIWAVRFLSFPRVQFLCGLGVVLLLSLALPDRFRWTGVLTSAAALSAIAFQIWVLVPYSPLVPVQAAAAQECATQNQLSLLEANVQMTNEHDDRLFRMIKDQKPDVLLVEEVDEWWNQKLKDLHGEYPYFRHYVTQNYYGIALLSKYPVTSADVHFPADARDPAIFATVKLPSGDEVRLYGIHPRPPEFGQSSAERDAQIMAAALAVRTADDPAILAGDMNATPWSPVVRRAARIGRMLDPRVGRDWKPSWKAGATVMRWPLDEVLVTPQFTVAELQVLPPFGSDHQPVLTRLCYAPANGSTRDVPRTDPGDLPAARAAVVKGQNKAEHSPEPKPGKQEPES